MKVEWRPVVGYEGWYEVSSEGRLRRCRPLTGRANSDGYTWVLLSRQGVREDAALHRLVAEAFHGPRPQGYQVNHKDGDKSNNSPSNLEYVTCSENVKHAYRLGLNRGAPKGSRNQNARLTEDLVSQIRASSEPASVIARRIGVSLSTVCLARKGKTWAHVKTPASPTRKELGLAMLHDGTKPHDVASALGVHPQTVYGWRRAEQARSVS